MRHALLLALAAATLWGQEPHNDPALGNRLSRALTRAFADDDRVRFPAILDEPALDVRLDGRPDAHERPLDWAEVYANMLPGTLIVASGYTCDKCSRIHARPASGFIISESGLMVTNYHVVDIDNPSPLIAMDGAGNVHHVSGWVRVSERDDLAVLQLEGEGPFVPLSLAPQVPPTGSEVAVLGNPDKHYFFFSTGVVSRYFTRGRGHVPNLAITAPFARGSSGGPVVDRKGDVVGIVRATDSIYYTEHGEEQRDFQMVVRMVVPVDLLRKLLE